MSNATGDNYIPVRHPLLLLSTVMLSCMIITIDGTIANIALPHIQGSLSATQDQISWMLTSYIVASAILTPPSSFLAAKFGRQRLLIWCVCGFLITSMLCGAATTLGQMVLFRTLQGAAGAAIIPLGQALVMDHFPLEKRGHMLSIWGMGTMVGPIIGPTLGGYLTETLNWRWVFYVNVPLCLIALLGIITTIPSTRSSRVQPFDFLGFGLLSLCLGGFQLMLDRGHSLGWFNSAEIMVEATLAVLCFYLFTVHMLTTKNPFLEPRLFRDRNLLLGLITVALIQVVNMGQMALLPNYLQQLMHIPADTAGYLLMPRGAGSVFGMILTARLIGRIDSRHLMVFGLAVFGFSMYDMSRINLNISNNAILWMGFLQGFGMSFLSAPMTSVVFATLLPILRGEGAAMYNLMRNLGGSIGVSMFFTHIAEQTQVHHQRLTENITAFTPSATLPSAWSWQSAGGAMTLDAEILRQAASIAYLDSYLIMAVCLGLIIPMCFLFRAIGSSIPAQASRNSAIRAATA